jgi:hypothetical protein
MTPRIQLKNTQWQNAENGGRLAACGASRKLQVAPGRNTATSSATRSCKTLIFNTKARVRTLPSKYLLQCDQNSGQSLRIERAEPLDQADLVYGSDLVEHD